MTLRIGLIGYGSWTRMAYIPALQRDGRAQIVSAAAPSAATQQRIASELGAECLCLLKCRRSVERPACRRRFRRRFRRRS